ncbi:MAG: S-methyl-5-thioribose-1-phosphate isomerase [Actinobacteria bacterium]|jgi:methylthioribose-1-phosphate isomerase|nr:S-methyl-5-thioribose-1-phosphate isomerase [Actinomycetota bacterium]
MEIRSIEWTPDGVVLLDQTLLPKVEKNLTIKTVDELIDAIKRLAVRGAPALGVAGAFGVVVALDQAKAENWDETKLEREINSIRDARPTAVNLAWGVNQVRPMISQGRDAVLAAAQKLAAQDRASNTAMGNIGADWLISKLGDRKFRLLTHCNTGSLATTGTGTALGVIKELYKRGKILEVFADETRPLLQGSRLTAWELAKSNIPYRIQPDGAAAMAILSGKIDAALIGADRIAKNGDSANKIGSLGVALACHIAKIPFLVVAPESTVDRTIADGSGIHIEIRGDYELTHIGDTQIAPDGAQTFNPAFDVTPAKFISAVITELKSYEIAEGQTL